MSAPRLTETEKRAMAKAYTDGEPTKLIAYRFSVSRCYPSILAKRRKLKARNMCSWWRAA